MIQSIQPQILVRHNDLISLALPGDSFHDSWNDIFLLLNSLAPITLLMQYLIPITYDEDSDPLVHFIPMF